MNILIFSAITDHRAVMRGMEKRHQEDMKALRRSLESLTEKCDHLLPDGRSAMNMVGDQCTICLEGRDHQ